MTIFTSDSRGIEAWGPTASVSVKVSALGSIVDNSWILVNFALGAREIVDVRQCFNEVAYIYALGHNQGACQMTMTFAVLIGSKKCSGRNNTSALKDGLRQYVLNRISKKTKAGTIAIGNFAGSGWLTGIDMGNVDANKGVCYATVNFLIRIASN